MTNFFSNNENGNNLFSKVGENPNTFGDNSIKQENNSLNAQYKSMEQNYEQIFVEAIESIRRSIEEFKPKDACENCTNKDCKIENKDAFAPYPPSGCKLRDWQMQILSFLNGEYRQRLKTEYKLMMDKKNDYECNQCGACCKLAVSEYSYTQLKQRASRGDKFSEEFISVFVPFESEEDAKKVNPEYFELLNTLVDDTKIYYYYCPRVKDNLCSIYENRPNICKDYPYHPLKLLPSECSFNAWKNDVSHQAMLLKAKTDIINFYKEQLG